MLKANLPASQSRQVFLSLLRILLLSLVAKIIILHSFKKTEVQPTANRVLFGFFLSSFPSRFFKTRLLGRGFHTLIKNVSFSSPTDMGSHNPPPLGPLIPFSNQCGTLPPIHPLQGPVSLLAHRLVSTPLSGLSLFAGTSPVSGSDCPSPPLLDIVLFELSLSGFPLRF